MSQQNMVMIFRGDELLKFGNTSSYESEGKGLNTKGYLPPGEYTVVHCGVSFIGNQLTVTNLGVRRAQSDIPVFFSNLFFIDEKTPENVTITGLTPKILSQAQRDKIISHLKSQGSWFWDYAVPEVKKALKPVLSIEDEALALVSQGRGLVSQKVFQQAISQFEQAIKIYPKISGARVDLGKAYLELGQVEEAIQCLEKELTQATDPQVLNANLYLAAIFDAKGNTAKYRMHLAAVVATEDYRRNPISMDPAVVRKIKAAVAAQAGPKSSIAVPGTTQKPTTVSMKKQVKSAPRWFKKIFGNKEPSICPHFMWGQYSLQTYGPKCAGLSLSRPVTRETIQRFCMGDPHKCSIFPIARRIPWFTHPPYVCEDAHALAEVKRWLENK